MFTSFDEFLAFSQANIPIFGFIINMTLTALLAIILSWVYTKYGNSLSNRRQFGRIFLVLALTTTLIISIIKSSLALSLGLVGALSIIRFRAAIKEPEELAYLFLTIGIGLGFGANQTMVTIIAYIIILSLIIAVKRFSNNVQDNQNLYLTIQSIGSKKTKIERVIEVLETNCDVIELRRFDESKDKIEASFMVEIQDFTHLNKAKNELQKLNEDLKITFLDNKGLL